MYISSCFCWLFKIYCVCAWIYRPFENYIITGRQTTLFAASQVASIAGTALYHRTVAKWNSLRSHIICMQIFVVVQVSIFVLFYYCPSHRRISRAFIEPWYFLLTATDVIAAFRRNCFLRAGLRSSSAMRRMWSDFRCIDDSRKSNNAASPRPCGLAFELQSQSRF